jgi:hypothetical protein
MKNNIKKNGCVYFFKHNGLSPIKIGFSQNESPFERFTQFKTYAPFGASIIDFVICENPLSIEKYLHDKFNIFRLEGEWFNIEENILKSEILYLKSKYEINEEKHKQDFADFIHRKTKTIDNLLHEDLLFSFENKENSEKKILSKKELLIIDTRLTMKKLNELLKEHNIKYKPYRVKDENNNNKIKKGIEIFI